MHQQVNWQPIEEHLSRVTGHPFALTGCYSVNGGCIHYAYRIEDTYNKQVYFIKLNIGDKFEMLRTEAAGLMELAQTGVIRVPAPICWGTTPHHAYLVMEAFTLRSDNFCCDNALGQQLAGLHRIHSNLFGWQQNNYIGSTPQINTLLGDWVSFWREQRLHYQLNLAAQKGYDGALLQSNGEQLLIRLEAFFAGYTPKPSLLHGDLWSGNRAVDSQGNPVIFDPAVYYGDRETDIAMTELFGGFSPQFYEAYQANFPLDDNYKTRKNLYNLYHILNHLNLFGGSYLRRAEQMISQLLSEVR